MLIDLRRDGFSLTAVTQGVLFDIDGDGKTERVAWTSPGSDDGWLVLDRDGNGLIDNGKELFGNWTAQPPSPRPNGFLALTEFDSLEKGGNGDSIIDARDAVFRSLRIWQDGNYNAISELGELHSLVKVGIEAIHLEYKKAKFVDVHGNEFRYRSKVDGHAGRWAYDVYLKTER